MQAAAELALADHERRGQGIERIEFAGGRAWFKRSALSGKSRWRWGAKRAFGARLPRVAEYYNLSWLTERLFQTPLPLAAGVLSRGGWPLRQFLLTADVPDAIPLDVYWRDRAHAERQTVLDELARETARMHALGFVHHDLYPRNVLVRATPGPRHLVFLDAWAGGPPPQLRGPAYDFACLLLRADTQLAPAEIERLLARYEQERRAQSRPVDVAQLLTDAKRIRQKLIRRLIERPGELRGEAPPSLEW